MPSFFNSPSHTSSILALCTEWENTWVIGSISIGREEFATALHYVFLPPTMPTEMEAALCLLTMLQGVPPSPSGGLGSTPYEVQESKRVHVTSCQGLTQRHEMDMWPSFVVSCALMFIIPEFATFGNAL